MRAADVLVGDVLQRHVFDADSYTTLARERFTVKDIEVFYNEGLVD